MNPILWTVVGVVAAAFGVTTGFFTVSTANRILESGVKLSGPRRLMVRFWFYLGALCDFVYNVTVGTLRFRELPRELMYSSRIQRLVDKGNARAIGEARMLNAAWPDHVKRLPDA